MNKIFKNISSRASFTLIELLVVIAILAVLATAVVLVLNPAEMVKAARDSTRLSDLASVNNALILLQGDNQNASLGTAAVVSVSIPDSSPTCANLGLPTLPPGYTYHCAPTSTLTRTDGTGWIPVDLTQFSAGAILSKLPIDPVNTTSTGNYYTYIPGGSWELTAVMESQKQQIASEKQDKGTSLFASEIGSDLTLTPSVVEERRIVTSIPKNMVLWLNARSGVTKDSQNKVSVWGDQSGSGNSLSQVTGSYQPTYVAEVQNQLPGIRFDGSPGVTMNFLTYAGTSMNDFTIFLVAKTTTTDSTRGVFSGCGNACTWINSAIASWDLRIGGSYYHKVFSSSWSDGNVNVITMRRSGTTGSAYLNGVDKTSTSTWNNSAVAFYKLGTWSNAVADINLPYNGYMFELLVYNYALSDADRANVESYLQNKYR
jgi:prepilin-type N-terminal cleavage/methylation domain-containing protein